MGTQELVVDPSAVPALPESIVLKIMSLNVDDLLWHKLVCRAARDAFSNPTHVPAYSAKLPLWALHLMLRTNTPIQQRIRVAAGRATAADIPGLALLKASSSDAELQHTFGPPVYAAAAQSGHINVLQWLQAASKGRGIRDWDHTVCTAAARAGRLDVLEWLRSQEPRCPWSSSQVWEGAAASGNIDMLQWLKDQQCSGLDSSSICTAAAGAGQVAVLEWVKQQLRMLFLDAGVFHAAVAGGHYNVLQWLQQVAGSAGQVVLGSAECAAAAAGGYLAVLRFLREEIVPPTAMSSTSCIAAARGGHLEVLKYLRAQGCPWSPAVCAAAAGGQHLHVLLWLRSQDPPCPWDFSTCKAAAQSGHLDILKWLRSQPEPCPFHKSVVLEAVEACQLDVVKWLVDSGCPYDRWIDTIAYSRMTCCYRGDVKAAHDTKSGLNFTNICVNCVPIMECSAFDEVGHGASAHDASQCERQWYGCRLWQ